MAAKNVLRDSLIIMAMVILFFYAAGSVLSLFTGGVPSGEGTGRVILLVLAVLAVLGLGFVLWRSETPQSRS
jgi:hypothetical protein